MTWARSGEKETTMLTNTDVKRQEVKVGESNSVYYRKMRWREKR